MFEFLALTGFLFGVVIVAMLGFAKGNTKNLKPAAEEKAELERYTSGISSNQHDQAPPLSASTRRTYVMMSVLKISIQGYNLPGIRFGDPHVGDVKEPVYVGIQQGKETIDLQPADLREVEFGLELKVAQAKDGRPNFLGPFAQGKADDKFVYLGWFQGGEAVVENRFRRTKIRLSHLSWADIERALKVDQPLVARIDLTSDDGGPLCGSTTSENIEWRMF